MKRFLLALALVLALLPGCARPATRLTIGVRNANDHVPFFLADDLGYYQSAELQAEVRVFPSNTELVEAARRGEVQLGAVPAPSAVAAIAHGAPLVIVAMTGRGSDALLVRADSGITDLAGLRGRRVGTIRGSILDLLLRQSLQAAGMDADRDLQIEYFSQLGDMLTALRSGQIDAASHTEPFLTQAEQEGWGRILFYYTHDWPDHPCCVVFARRDMVERQPDLVERVLRVHAQAVDLAAADPLAAARAIAKRMKGFDLRVIQASLAPDKMRIDDHLEAAEIERLAEAMYAQGLIERLPGRDEMVNLRFLERLGR
ncbi:MAG: ABC transporter substrate-binding protein [Anaerolineae bacterium]